MHKKKDKLIRDEKDLEALKAKLAPEVQKIEYDFNILEKKLQMHEGYGSYTESERKLAQL